jgi:hypothetical protein
MNEKDLISMLKEKLSIEIKTERSVGCPEENIDGDLKIKISLYYDGIKISSSEVVL